MGKTDGRSGSVACACGEKLLDQILVIGNQINQRASDRTGSNEDQKDSDNERVKTGRLCDNASEDHRARDVTLALGLSSDSLARFTYGIAFSDTGAYTCDHCDSCAESAAA
jgi:hypothetical protein